MKLGLSYRYNRISSLQKHSKSYPDSDEESSRYNTWRANKDLIDRHNQHADLLGFTLEMNKFGDLVPKIIYVEPSLRAEF